MIHRVLWRIAGVDRKTLATCPVTDKVWATHLGFALLLSLTVVLGISFHATGYVIANVGTRFAVASVVALTVFMFDRALYQSDWFYQGSLSSFAAAAADKGFARPSVRRALRIAVRLSMSFGLAWVIAVFLELAIFSDTIAEKIQREHILSNQPIYQKIAQYEAELGSEIEAKRASLAALEALFRGEVAAPMAAEPLPPEQLKDIESELSALDVQESELRADLRQIQETIKGYAADMNAEQVGRRVSKDSSGRPGAGPRYQFAKAQKELYEAQQAIRQDEIRQLLIKRDALRTMQTRIATDATERRNQARDSIQSKQDALQLQINEARVDLKQREAGRQASIDDFRRHALAASDFKKQKDDPLSRMTAYQELKNDPKDGETITLFSWMTKFLIIFLEVVPVIAKMFFSPPSVYAAKIQAEVDRERRRVETRMAANDRQIELEPAIETAVASLPNEPVLSNSSGFANAQIALRERYNTLQQSLTSAREPDAGPTIVPAEHRDSNFIATDKSEAFHTARIEIGDGPEIDAVRERAELVARLQNVGRGPADRLREPFVRPPLSFSLQDDIIKNQ